MGFLERDADNIVSAIKNWPPQAAQSEAEYEAALYAHLNAEFPLEVFQRQYALGRTRADLFVAFKNGAKVAIEVKRDLAARNEYHRTIGQVYEYLTEWKVEVVLVLCGENDPAVEKLLERAVKFLGSGVRRKARVSIVATG